MFSRKGGEIPVDVTIWGAHLLRGDEKLEVGMASRVPFERAAAELTLPLSMIERRIYQLKSGDLLPRTPAQFPDEFVSWLSADPMLRILRQQFSDSAVEAMQTAEGFLVGEGKDAWRVHVGVYDWSRALVEQGCEGKVIEAVEVSGELPVPGEVWQLLELVDRAVYVDERSDHERMGPAQLARYHVFRGQSLGGNFEYDLGGMTFRVAGVERRNLPVDLASPFTFKASDFRAARRAFLELQ